MKAADAAKLLGEVDATISSIKSLGLTDPLPLSYLAKYLVVYVCGIYEETIELILREKFSRLKTKYIAEYLSNKISWSFRNPDFEKIRELLKSFNSNWEKKIKRIPQLNKDAISSIVTLKNNLAHKGSATVTWNEAVQYYKDSRLVIEEVDKIVL